MGIRSILTVVETIILLTTAGIFSFIILFFLFTLGFSSLKDLTIKIQNRTKRKLLDVLYKYLLGEIPLTKVKYKRFQRESIIDAFSTIISTITGKKKRRMKNAVIKLGLTSYIERGLLSISPSKRIRSCYTLGILGSKQNIQYLTDKLFDRNPKVISAAIVALGEIKDSSTVKALIGVYKNCSLSHAWLIAAILPFFGTWIYKKIKPLLNDPELSVTKRILLIKIVSNFKLTESLEVLQSLYTESKNLDIRINALVAIGKINDLFAVKTAIDALSDPEWQVRAIACTLIGEMAIKGATYRLVLLLKDESWYVRKNAAAALVRLGKIGIAALLDAIDTDDNYARDMAVQTLEEKGIVEDIIKQLKDPKKQKRKEAFRILNSLVKTGYKKYLDNYRSSNSIVEELLH